MSFQDSIFYSRAHWHQSCSLASAMPGYCFNAAVRLKPGGRASNTHSHAEHDNENTENNNSTLQA
ncbi:MAG TPA: hypothetical protein V6C65_28605 [Allocoleopsis sp.]